MQTLVYRVGEESESRIVFYAKEIFIQILPVFDGKFISMLSICGDTSEKFRADLSDSIIDPLNALKPEPEWVLIEEEHEFPGMFEAAFTLEEEHRIELLRIIREVKNQYRNELTAIPVLEATAFLIAHDEWMLTHP